MVARGPRPGRAGAGPVEVGGSHTVHFEYHDRFAEAWYREDATIEGLSQVHWDAASSTLEVRGSAQRRRVRLCYQFVSPFVMKDIAAEMNNVTRDGEKCSSYAECHALLLDGANIDYDGASGPLDFVDAGEPGAGTYELFEYDAEGESVTFDVVDIP